jgi:hypothetical protein
MNNDRITDDKYKGNYTGFPNEPITLKCGDYQCTNSVKLMYGDDKKIFYFPQPITITKLIRNIKMKTIKVELSFRRFNKWETITIDKDIISKFKSITLLSKFGILVTDDNAKGLVQYLHTLEVLNEFVIPCMDSISSFGYVEGKGFVPYCDNIDFDRQTEFKNLFESIQQKGEYREWVEKVKPLMAHSKILNAVICSSLASVLIKPLGGLSAFVHLYSTESGSGKTSALNIAGSVWGNPEKYNTTFNSTAVSLELYAGVLNELPLLIDELQLQNDSKNQKHFNPYLLTTGEGRNRANKELGIRENFYWKNFTITTGETPLSNSSGGAGEHNRIIEFEINGLTDLFPSLAEAGEMFNFTRTHHGHLGKRFTDWLYSNPDNLKQAEFFLNHYEKKLVELGVTGKQSRSGAFILTANTLIVNYTFINDNDNYFDSFDYRALLLSPEWLAEYLKSEQKVDIVARAYETLCNEITVNSNKFVHKYRYKNNTTGADETGSSSVVSELYGLYDRTDENNITVYINKIIFDRLCSNNKFDPRSILSGLKRKNLIKTSKNRNTMMKWIDNCYTSVVCLYIKVEPQ